MNLQEAAAISGFSPDTLRQRAAKGLFPACQPRGRRGGWDIDEAGFRAWLKSLRISRGNSAMKDFIKKGLIK